MRGGAGNGVVVRQSFFSGGVASVAVATGLLLDVVAAAVFGAGRDTDAFVAAARFPLALTAILMLCRHPGAGADVHHLGDRRSSDAAQARSSPPRCWPSVGRRDRGRGAAGRVAAVPMVARDGAGLRGLASEHWPPSCSRVMVWTIPLTAGCEVLRAWLNARHMFVIPAAMTVMLNVGGGRDRRRRRAATSRSCRSPTSPARSPSSC